MVYRWIDFLTEPQIMLYAGVFLLGVAMVGIGYELLVQDHKDKKRLEAIFGD